MTRSLADFGVAAHLAAAPDNILRELIQLSLDAKDLISLAGGLPADDLMDTIGIREATERVLSGNTRAYLQYGATEGVASLRERLAGITRDRGVAVDETGVVVTSGAQQANDLVARCLLQPGDGVLVERPTFVTALQTFRAAQATLFGVGSDRDGPMVSACEEAVAAARAQGRRIKLFYVVPTFTNPAGRVTTEARRRDLIAFALRHGITIVEDDPYGELWFDHPPPPPLAALADEEAAAHVIYVSSLSKTLSPGLRVGWLCAPAALSRAMRLMKSTADIHSSVFAQSVADAYLASGRLAARAPVLRSGYKARCSALATALDAHLGDSFAFEAPEGGMFIWGRLNGVDDTNAFARRAVSRAGVSVVPGEPFFEAAPETGWLRLSFSQGAHATLADGARRLARAVEAWREA